MTGCKMRVKTSVKTGSKLESPSRYKHMAEGMIQKIFILALLSLILISGCSVRYTNFSYQVRGCIESDKSSITSEGTSISIARVVNFTDIRFEKQENIIKMYYRTKAPCKLYNIEIMNLTSGTYTLETYDIKYEDVSFFELTNVTNVTIQ